ncbi:MAG: ImmA/IrrE family metallo-endopeptidase [Terriglobia bacterium]|jgi:Zn-dependent peptidase ImmA (M78 family)|nr:ImmA/IrrE family metallo-endopeptidase [Terriglobia bacterium]
MDTLRIGGRRYSDPDIISLCRQSGELIDPRSTVVNLARSLTEKANRFLGLPDDPLERLKIIASLNRIKILPMDMDQVRSEKRDAALYPTPSGWTVLYNPNRLRARIVFTIAHEIVHTFFPNSTSGARFRAITNPSSREANELELLCHLGASELVMPLDQFQRRANGRFGLSAVETLASYFGTSFEATVYRLATAHPGFAVAGMLKYRLTKDEERRLTKAANQGLLFSKVPTLRSQPAERKYRRQSVHLSPACREEEYTIRFNKSFDPSSVVYKAREGGIHSGVENLPNLANVSGQIEAMLCPYQGDNAGEEFGDVFFFWEELIERL